ncbi:MAG: hypothetical protein CM15mP117_13680 [Alphaproteobacteria bacterium]|nr:MAG: hypothetical protein CM15mP117_13680 [Alphaproteobacteria bacterium]
MDGLAAVQIEFDGKSAKINESPVVSSILAVCCLLN